jgi:hypothetical protein
MLVHFIVFFPLPFSPDVEFLLRFVFGFLPPDVSRDTAVLEKVAHNVSAVGGGFAGPTIGAGVSRGNVQAKGLRVNNLAMRSVDVLHLIVAFDFYHIFFIA